MMMRLRVLIIEDSEDDEMLLLRELQRIGYEVEFERVENAEAMQEALTRKTWDVILSDYTLPEFDAPRALEVMKASGLDLPFIIISGTIGEDTAVAALKAGAHDFLVKGEFARLGPAIERELSEAETRLKHRQAETQIHFQFQRLKGLRAIDMAISSSFDINVTLDIILQQVVLQLNVDAAAILLLNSHTQTLEYVGSRGFHSDALIHSQFILNESFPSRALRERRIVHSSDLLKARGNFTESLQQLVGEDFVDYYGVPLLAKTGGKGVLEIFHRSPLNTGPEWREFAETLAGEAAIAIDNAQLFDNLERANADLERRVKLRTEELNQLNIELTHANHAKDEFLANMSHELRTPLNSILGFSETLLEKRRGPLNEKQEQYINLIHSSGQHLLGLINDILEVSKIEAGKLDIYPDIISVKEICESSLNFVRELALKKSIMLEFQTDPSLQTLRADPQRMKQILVNLLNNAVKFTPKGGKVSLVVQTNPEKDQIQFSVIDTGIGISHENLSKLFTPFTQLESSLSREYEGTGLGLMLVLKFTELHGGSVMVESEPDVGSQFIITLPWSELDINTPKDVSKPTVSDKGIKDTESISGPLGKILLADDSESNILTVNEYLSDYGYEVAVAHNGIEAIAMAEELSPDMVLMDIQMPKLDGLEAIRRIRSIPEIASIPIIALTALAMPGDRERCLAAGANEYMSKPVSLKALIKTMRKLMNS